MNTQQVVIHGRICSDGTLQVEEKLNLPPGPVSVTVQTVLSEKVKPTLNVLEEIWAERRAHGLVARSKEEIDAEIAEMRAEDENRICEIEAIEHGCQSFLTHDFRLKEFSNIKIEALA